MAKVALVTGGTRGIGAAISIGLKNCGYKVAANYAGNDEAAAKFKAETGIPVYRWDVSNYKACAEGLAKIAQEVGPIDILVNNAGILPSRVFPHELALEHWQQTIGVSLTGTFLCTQHALRRMMQQGHGGSIVNVSSIAGVLALGRGNLPHSVSKSGVNQFTREVAVEYASHGIRVNAICPAQILTPAFKKWMQSPSFSPALRERLLMGIPLNRLLEPEEFVGPVVFLCSDAASIVTGVILPVDGGNLALNAGGSHTWPEAQ
jgi:acetoacetyl-CoA reductase